MTGPRLHLVIGPGEHGVVRFGLELASAMGDRAVHRRDPRPPQRSTHPEGAGSATRRGFNPVNNYEVRTIGSAVCRNLNFAAQR